MSLSVENTNQKFSYAEFDKGIVIKEYAGNDSMLVLPEEVGGRRVVKLDAYSFHEHRELQEIQLPFGLEEIGAHAFYNCRNMVKVCMGDSITAMGDGAFKNCSKINEIEMHRVHGCMNSLHGILGELNQELTVSIFEQDNKAVLIFPYYTHDFEENTPARIVTQVTVGAGVFYRECVSAESIDYAQYDSIFEKAIHTDVSESVYKIALCRRIFPLHLSKKNQKIYDLYIIENKTSILENLLRGEQFDLLVALLQINLFSREDIHSFAEMARVGNYMKALGLILEYQRQKFGTVKKTFDF